MSHASDPSHGYEAVAEAFRAGRSPTIGVATVRAWAETLPAGATVLDLGCGSGVPITEVLVAARLTVFGIDASPTLVAAFRERFPGVPVECNAVEASAFFERTFDAIIAWGLLFLLPPEVQGRVIQQAAAALRPGGHFLFTAPAPRCQWVDVLTGRPSESLGAPAYRALLADAGLILAGEADDEGDNHYFSARRPVPAPG